MDVLTTREREVLQLVVDGLSDKDVARRLSLSVRTVQFHLQNVFAKFRVNNRLAAALKARMLTRTADDSLRSRTIAGVR